MAEKMFSKAWAFRRRLSQKRDLPAPALPLYDAPFGMILLQGTQHCSVQLDLDPPHLWAHLTVMLCAMCVAFLSSLTLSLDKQPTAPPRATPLARTTAMRESLSNP